MTSSRPAATAPWGFAPSHLAFYSVHIAVPDFAIEIPLNPLPFANRSEPVAKMQRIAEVE
jgi:hypothetical protein